MKSFESRMRAYAYPAARDTINIVDEADAIRLAIEADKLIKPPCKWSYEEMTYSWDTGCGDKQTFQNGYIKENYYKFCPYCGGQIEEVDNEKL